MVTVTRHKNNSRRVAVDGTLQRLIDTLDILDSLRFSVENHKKKSSAWPTLAQCGATCRCTPKKRKLLLYSSSIAVLFAEQLGVGARMAKLMCRSGTDTAARRVLLHALLAVSRTSLANRR